MPIESPRLPDSTSAIFVREPINALRSFRVDPLRLHPELDDLDGVGVASGNCHSSPCGAVLTSFILQSSRLL